MKICPCRSGRTLSACCGPYLNGEALAPTAEALMRSRFSAFCEGAIDHLVRTHKAEGNIEGLRKSAAETEWMNLLIVKTQKGGVEDTTGVVEFVAAFRRKPLSALALAPSGPSGELMQLHERSLFVREEGRWLYVSGDQLPAYQTKRGEPCWCGSGKKTKACHRS